MIFHYALKYISIYRREKKFIFENSKIDFSKNYGWHKLAQLPQDSTNVAQINGIGPDSKFKKVSADVTEVIESFLIYPIDVSFLVSVVYRSQF